MSSDPISKCLSPEANAHDDDDAAGDCMAVTSFTIPYRILIHLIHTKNMKYANVQQDQRF